jgi:hypothetical protein
MGGKNVKYLTMSSFPETTRSSTCSSTSPLRTPAKVAADLSRTSDTLQQLPVSLKIRPVYDPHFQNIFMLLSCKGFGVKVVVLVFAL